MIAALIGEQRDPARGREGMPYHMRHAFIVEQGIEADPAMAPAQLYRNLAQQGEALIGRGIALDDGTIGKAVIIGECIKPAAAIDKRKSQRMAIRFGARPQAAFAGKTVTSEHFEPEAPLESMTRVPGTSREGRAAIPAIWCFGDRHPIFPWLVNASIRQVAEIIA